MKGKNIEKQKGITILALVITIVILLILAGVTIGTLTGDNGLLGKANEAKNESEIAEEKEIIDLATTKAMAKNKFGDIEKDILQDAVDSIAGENKCEIYQVGDKFRAFFNKSNRWYVIDNNGNISEWVLNGETDGIYIGDTIKETINLDGAMVLSPVQNQIPSVEANLNYIWTSSDPSIATVTADGIVICGTKKGTATITCKGANSKSTCEVTTTGQIVYKNDTNGNKTINGESASYSNPSIPAGYSALTTMDAQWNTSGSQTCVDKGLVIIDNRGNQFAWIPVPNVIYDGITEIKNGYTPMSVLQDNSTQNYKGISYAFDGASATRENSYNNIEPSTVSSDFIENDEEKGFALIRKYISGMQNKTNSEIRTAWENELQDEYNKLINSISKYGGFWLGRYEASYDINQNRLASIAGVQSTTANDEATKTWYSFYQKIKDYCAGGNYSSTMIWGSQYDAMLNWMAVDGIEVGSKGTLVDGTSSNSTKIAGNPRFNDKIKNICDLYGGVGEWTQEAYLYAGGRHSRANAGADICSKYGFATTDRTPDRVSSRITLYMK